MDPVSPRELRHIRDPFTDRLNTDLAFGVLYQLPISMIPERLQRIQRSVLLERLRPGLFTTVLFPADSALGVELVPEHRSEDSAGRRSSLLVRVSSLPGIRILVVGETLHPGDNLWNRRTGAEERRAHTSRRVVWRHLTLDCLRLGFQLAALGRILGRRRRSQRPLLGDMSQLVGDHRPI